MHVRLPGAFGQAGGVMPVRRGLHLRGHVHVCRLQRRERPPDGEPVMPLPYLIGFALALGVALLARRVGLDRERAFYPTVMIVVASYYVLFAVMSGSAHTILVECLVMALFARAALVGFRSSPWIVVAALAGHGAFDALHGHVVHNSGMPAWWPAFCLSYDFGAAAAFAWLLRRELPATAVRV